MIFFGYCRYFIFNLCFLLIKINHNESKELENGTNPCYWFNPITNETWKLIWQEEFHTKNFDEWIVEHETASCTGNWLDQVHCNTNRLENVDMIDDYLVLVARKESYFGHEFTAASMTTKEYFTYGRYEIRMSNPIGNFLRPSVFTRNHLESYWHENGQIDLFSDTQGSIIFRGIHYADSTSFYEPADLPLSDVGLESLHGFHLFGIEWNNESVRFFLDDHYGPTIKLSNESKNPLIFDYSMGNDVPFLEKYLKPFHQLRFQLGVGGRFFIEKIISDKINWKCPAMVVDYVRVFEFVDSIGINDGISSECHFGPNKPSHDQKILKKVCSSTAEVSEDVSTVFGKSYLASNLSIVIILILVLIISFIIVSIYLALQIKKFGSKVSKQVDLYGTPVASFTRREEGSEIYEMPVYEDDQSLMKADSLNRELPKLIPKAIQNEYLEIKPTEDLTSTFRNNPDADYINLAT